MSWLSTRILKPLCLIVVLFLTVVFESAALAQTVDVRVDGDNGLAVPNPPEGDTWTNAYKYLPDALVRAQFLLDNNLATTVRLWVASTVPSNPYRPDRDAANEGGTGDLESTFLLNFNNVQVLGGFIGNETDPSDRDPAVNLTVLSGELIFGGFDCGDPDAGDCFVDNGTPGCNDATCCEAVCNVDPDCCEVTWDQACADFANFVCGVCGEPGSGDCFEANDTPGCEDGNCCALVCSMDPICCIFPWNDLCAGIAIDNCTGGEVPLHAYHVVTAENVNQTVHIDGFTIKLGVANGAGTNGLGGGMFISNASLAVVRVTFTENSAPGHGGGAMHIEGSAHPILINCEFIANEADEGGAIHTEFGNAGATLVNCLLAGNTATDHGGAIDHGGNFAEMELINCTITDNTAETESGGAIFIHFDGQVTAVNSIMWANVPDEIFIFSGSADVTYSDVEGGWPCPPGMPDCGNIGDDLILDDPLFVDPLNDNYRLLADSPCIDVGNPEEAVIPCDQFDLDNDGDTCDPPNNYEPTPDLDLGDRVVDGDEDPTATVDMGAYESVPCPADLDNSCDVGVKDLLILLGAWGPNPGHPADLVVDGVVGVKDLLFLLGAWGPCQCNPGAVVLSLDEKLTEACVSEEHWDEFEDKMKDPNASQEEKDNYYCWMDHYLFDCTCLTCMGALCPGPDPYIP